MKWRHTLSHIDIPGNNSGSSGGCGETQVTPNFGPQFRPPSKQSTPTSCVLCISYHPTIALYPLAF